MTDTDVAGIAERLSRAQQDILERICTGTRLPLATRAQDSFRQSMRRLGLVHVVPNPRRWEALPLGHAVRAHLLSSDKEG